MTNQETECRKRKKNNLYFGNFNGIFPAFGTIGPHFHLALGPAIYVAGPGRMSSHPEGLWPESPVKEIDGSNLWKR